MSLRQQNKVRARANILDAANLLIMENGVAGTTTRDIAKHAGLSYQTLYNYYPSKGHLVKALMGAGLATSVAAVDDAIKHYNGDLLATLALTNRIGISQFTGSNQQLWLEVVTHLTTKASPDQSTTFNQISHERYHALLRMAQGMGQLRQNVDLHLLAHTIFGLVDYALLRFILAPQQDQGAYLHTLQEQFELLIYPYLVTA